jgi:sulfatase maturation enzyme AslB (radical SAM superfamily)
VSVEVNPIGLRCERACLYCYQGKVRTATRNAAPSRIDHERIQLQVKRAADKDGFSLFGGEPLLASVEDLEKLWAFGLEQYGRNGVQTDGNAITETHLNLFRRYHVHVGFSIDGPAELNDARRAGSLAATRAASAHSEAMLRRCLAMGIECSLIVTLHRLNASAERLQRLLEWFRDLDAAGLQTARLHLLELDGAGRTLALTSEENVAALFAIHDLENGLRGLRFDVFKDVLAKLRDPDASATCVWNACDPWTTPAVHGIEADGSRGLCHRVHKDGKQWSPADPSPLPVRQVVLWATPQEDGGCRGCRFFLQCLGQCPGTAIDGDWRRRSADCPTWFALLERVEAEMLARGEAPASLVPDLDERIQRRLAAAAEGTPHGDVPHGDVPHGDHTDTGAAVEALAGGEAVPA